MEVQRFGEKGCLKVVFGHVGKIKLEERVDGKVPDPVSGQRQQWSVVSERTAACISSPGDCADGSAVPLTLYRG